MLIFADRLNSEKSTLTTTSNEQTGATGTRHLMFNIGTDCWGIFAMIRKLRRLFVHLPFDTQP